MKKEFRSSGWGARKIARKRVYCELKYDVDPTLPMSAPELLQLLNS
jgi:hypothetical protein